MQLELISAVLLIICITLWQLRRRRFAKCINDFPGPAGWPIIGNLLIFRKIEHGNIFPLLNSYYKAGPKRFRLSVGNGIMIVLHNAKDVEAVLTNPSLTEKSDLYNFLHPWLGTGILTSAGKKWKSRRKLLTPCIHSNLFPGFVQVFNEQSDTLLEILNQQMKKSSFDIHFFIKLFTLDILCGSILNVKINALKDYKSSVLYVKAVDRLKEIVHTRIHTPYLWPNLIFRLFPEGRDQAKYLMIVHEFTDKVIRERKCHWEQKSKTKSIGNTTKKPHTFLDTLLEASDTCNLSDSDIREEVNAAMFGGHDTSAVAISWALSLLGNNQHIQIKVQEELDSILGEDKNKYTTIDDLNRMKYLECVIKESQRLYPPVPFFGRLVKTDTVIDGKNVPATATLAIAPYFLHRDPVVFPNPETFDPSRFFPENCVNRHPYAYIPFAPGIRNCLGQKFAMLSIKVILSRLLHSFNVKSIDPQDQIEFTFKLVIMPKNGINVHLTPRNNEKPTWIDGLESTKKNLVKGALDLRILGLQD